MSVVVQSPTYKVFPRTKKTPSKPLSTIGFHKFGLTKHGNDYVDTLVNIY